MKRFYERLCKHEMRIAQVALAALSVLVLVAAIARTLHYPLNWAMDAATFLFAWSVFLGADAAMRLDRLFCIEAVTGRLPRRGRYLLQLVNYAIIAAFLLGMIGYGLWLSYTTRLRTFQGIPGFSYTWVTLSVPVGCALMLLTAVLKMKAYVRGVLRGEAVESRAAASGEII